MWKILLVALKYISKYGISNGQNLPLMVYCSIVHLYGQMYLLVTGELKWVSEFSVSSGMCLCKTLMTSWFPVLLFSLERLNMPKF